MKNKILVWPAVLLTVFSIVATIGVFIPKGADGIIGEDEENEMYDGPDQADMLEFAQTHDLSLGRIPRERMLAAIDQATASKAEALRQSTDLCKPKTERGDTVALAPTAAGLLSWAERGPNSDSIGPSNGNTRANNGKTAGRVRAILVDANDATGKTVFVGGVDGGLWKTTDITVAAPTWTLVTDRLLNIAISDIVQDPRPGFTNIMYMGTGEGYRNADAVRGNGIFKSIDGGATWTYLSSTSTFLYTTRLAIDSSGNVYAGTRISGGLYRSLASDGGAVWNQNITPSGVASVDVCDLKISSTGRLHATFGIIATNSYRFTDTPATVTAAGWTSATTAFTVSPVRTQIAVSGNTLYACPVDASYQVPTIFKSIDGGANWAATTGQPASGWASGQGWYSLSIAINPADAGQVIVGGLDNYKSIDGLGATWVKISAWVGTVGQYVHADQHKAIWYDNGNKLLFGSDGGVFYSTDGGTTISDRNAGLRIKQFYSVAMNPTAGSNYFLAGAQDNGTHALSSPGLGASVEVTGGDGAFVAIDQDNANNQFGAYVYNQYRFSSDGGASWSSLNVSSSAGRFINPFELDSTGNVLYGSYASGQYLRWINAPTGATAAVTVSNITNIVSSVSVSPITANRVLLGIGSNPSTGSTTGAGKVFRIDGANTFVSGSAGVDISTGLPAGTNISNVAFGMDDNNLIASISNFGQQHVWITTDGGTSWTSANGNLPDMPVRWAMFKPGTNNQAIIGTEAGVWETTLLNGAATQWTADPTFPNVRVDMIRYRPSDGLFAAGTHGRGVWTGSIPTAADMSVSGRVLSPDGRGLRNAIMTIAAPNGATWTVQTGPRGNYSFTNIPGGETYTISVGADRFRFEPRTVTLNDSIANFDFYPVGGVNDPRNATEIKGLSDNAIRRY